MTTLKADIDKLARALLADALNAKGGGLLPKERVEVFKAASAWHLGVTKTGKKSDEDDDGAALVETFDKLAKRLTRDSMQ